MLLIWLLLLAFSLNGVSYWLQADAKPTDAVPGTTDFASIGYSSQNSLFARTVNTTLCQEENARLLNSLYKAPSCGLTE